MFLCMEAQRLVMVSVCTLALNLTARGRLIMLFLCGPDFSLDIVQIGQCSGMLLTSLTVTSLMPPL